MISAPLLDRVDVVVDHSLRNAQTNQAGSDIFNAFLCHRLSPCPMSPTQGHTRPALSKWHGHSSNSLISINLALSFRQPGGAQPCNWSPPLGARARWSPGPHADVSPLRSLRLQWAALPLRSPLRIGGLHHPVTFCGTR